MPKSQNTTMTRQARLAAGASPDATDFDKLNNNQKHAPLRLPKPAKDLREGMIPSLPYHFRMGEDALNLTIILNTSSRTALFADGRQPSDDEKHLVYQQIIDIVGPGIYTPKVHSNFCTKKQRDRTERLTRKRECPGCGTWHTTDSELPLIAFSFQWRLLLGGPGIIAAKMQENPNPTLLDLMRWEKETGGSFEDVYRTAKAEVSDVIKERVQGECLVSHTLSRVSVKLV